MGILSHQPQNFFHFVDAPSHYAPFKAPQPAETLGFSPLHSILDSVNILLCITCVLWTELSGVNTLV
uniref:Uncharacterized protein n=1 Tax=Arundo donax TaxID=35708 RepID=A0A0A9GS16_ARUDO